MGDIIFDLKNNDIGISNGDFAVVVDPSIQNACGQPLPLLRVRRPAARDPELFGVEKIKGGCPMKTVNQPVRKKDAMQLVTGQPVYMDDVIPQDCLIVKLLRSPHANAIVKNIDTSRAMLVPGMEVIYTWKDVDQNARRYTQAGQTYPEPSPYDRLVIDRHVRFAGDVVAILAGKDEKCVDKAMKLIKVRYEVLPAVLDYHTALDNPVLVHPEENWAKAAFRVKTAACRTRWYLRAP